MSRYGTCSVLMNFVSKLPPVSVHKMDPSGILNKVLAICYFYAIAKISKFRIKKFTKDVKFRRGVLQYASHKSMDVSRVGDRPVAPTVM
jgi:hypothetical protein